MTKATHFTCAACHQKFDTEQAETVANKKYCPTCAEAKRKAVLQRRRLFDFIDKHFNETGWINWGFLSTKISEISTKYDCSPDQMYYVLRYIYDEGQVTNPPPFTKELDIYRCLSYFKEAREYWQQAKYLTTTTRLIAEQAPVKPIYRTLIYNDLVTQAWLEKKAGVAKLDMDDDEFDDDDDDFRDKDFANQIISKPDYSEEEDTDE